MGMDCAIRGLLEVIRGRRKEDACGVECVPLLILKKELTLSTLRRSASNVQAKAAGWITNAWKEAGRTVLQKCC